MLVAGLAVLGWAAVAHATTVGGGGDKKTDCMAVMSAAGAPFPFGAKATGVTCTDGSDCDADGQVDGVCTIPVAICLNVQAEGCTKGKPVGSVTLKGTLNGKTTTSAKNQFASQVTALGTAANTLAASGGAPGQCTGVVDFTIPVTGPNDSGELKSRLAKLELKAKSNPQFGNTTDGDKYKIVCLPHGEAQPGETTTTSSSTTSSTVTTVSTATSTTVTSTTSTTLPIPNPPGAGLKAQITGVTVNAQRAIIVTFTLTDDAGNPVKPLTASTSDPNQARVRFTIARLETVHQTSSGVTTPFTRYRNYITTKQTSPITQVSSDQPTYDSGGTLATVNPFTGVYTYTFKTVLPATVPDPDGGADVDPVSLTHTVGGQVERTFNGNTLAQNPTFDFVPNGGTVTTVREVTTTAQCNSCHDPLEAHGGARREVHLCQLCHTDQAIDPDTGNTIDFKVMIHRIHRGVELPSVNAGPVGTKYSIIGFNQSETVWAEKVTACVGGPLVGVQCTADADCGTGGTCTGSKVTGVGFPQDLRNCTKCHSAGATSADFRQKPSTATCTSCHDDINPSTTDTATLPAGHGHLAGPQPEALCTVCHKPTEDTEYDITVPGAHTVPEQSTALAGLHAQILTATGTAGNPVTVTFKVTDDSGAAITSFAAFNRVAFAFSGPTTPDFGDPTAPGNVITPTAVGGGASGNLTGPDGSGVWTYVTSAGNALPVGAAGTWRIGIEARRSVQVGNGSQVGPVTVNEALQNAVLDFSVDGSPVTARRQVVDIVNCQNCHGVFSKGFSIHGNLRNQTEYCVICHNPSASDFPIRKGVANADPTNSTIDLKHFIHKLHTGDDLTHTPYIIYGFGNSANDFSDVHFPGDRRDCAACHKGTTYLLPLPAGVHATLVTQVNAGNETVIGNIPPTQDACLACHDSDAALAHAETNTTGAGAEACEVCHGAGAIADVAVVHMLPP
jgi:hypothetical protein